MKKLKNIFCCANVKTNPNIKRISKKTLIPSSKKLGIENPHKLSTKTLQNKVNRHIISKKVTWLFEEKIKKGEDFTKSDLDKAIDLYELSLSNLKKIAKLRGIKNVSELTKEDLIDTLLRLEKSQRERSYLKHISNAPNSEIKGRINHARMPLAKFGNILTKIERKAIRDELYRLENTKLRRTEKQRAVTYLVQITNTLYNKQIYNNSNHHDQTYYGIKDIEHLFNTTDHNDYYKVILARISF